MSYSTSEQRKNRRRQRHDEAEQNLRAASAQVQHEALEADPHGVGTALANMRAFAEDANEDLAEQQANQAMLAVRRETDERQRQNKIRRRQDYYESRRRGVRKVMQQQMGRPPSFDEFIAKISHLKAQDLEWSDDDIVDDDVRRPLF